MEPQLGDLTTGPKIGLKNRSRLMWAECPDCGKRRWVTAAQGPDRPCRSCSGKRMRDSGSLLRAASSPKPRQSLRQRGEDNPGWKGGQRMHMSGYRLVLIPWGDPLRVMGDKSGHVFEHRLVMARALGRPLGTREYVHHINGDRLDNRLENLELWNQAQPTGVRAGQYHCPGCRCAEVRDERPRTGSEAGATP